MDEVTPDQAKDISSVSKGTQLAFFEPNVWVDEIPELETSSGLQIRGSKFSSLNSNSRELELSNFFRARSRLHRSKQASKQASKYVQSLPEKKRDPGIRAQLK